VRLGNNSSGSPQIIVRKAQEEDIGALVDALAPEVSARQVAHRWQEHQEGYREMLVAEVNGCVIGTVSINGHRSRQSESLRMFALDVGSGFRHRGVGSALIEATEEEACRLGLRIVRLEVAVENHDAIRLYERLGYQRRGDPIEDCWWRLRDDGSHEEVREISHMMVKEISSEAYVAQQINAENY
jgi:ribosomal protein S18 acetylase RimI-like enzyme